MGSKRSGEVSPRWPRSLASPTCSDQPRRATVARVERYYEVNRANWDERAPAHAASPYYSFERFVEDQSYLSDVVRFDLPRLGDVNGLRGVHLQCHIGTDTLSLARLGAQMTGLDFSAPALEVARRLAADAGPPVSYVQSDVYEAVDALG